MSEDTVLKRVRAFEELESFAKDIAKVVASYRSSLMEERVDSELVDILTTDFATQYWDAILGGMIGKNNVST